MFSFSDESIGDKSREISSKRGKDDHHRYWCRRDRHIECRSFGQSPSRSFCTDYDIFLVRCIQMVTCLLRLSTKRNEEQTFRLFVFCGRRIGRISHSRLAPFQYGIGLECEREFHFLTFSPSTRHFGIEMSDRLVTSCSRHQFRNFLDTFRKCSSSLLRFRHGTVPFSY